MGNPSDDRRTRRERKLHMIYRRIEYLDRRKHEPDQTPHRVKWDGREQRALEYAYTIIQQAKADGVIADLEARAYHNRDQWLPTTEEEA